MLIPMQIHHYYNQIYYFDKRFNQDIKRNIRERREDLPFITHFIVKNITVFLIIDCLAVNQALNHTNTTIKIGLHCFFLFPLFV